MAKEKKDNIEFVLGHVSKVKKGMDSLRDLIKEAQDYYESKSSIVKKEKERSEMTTTDLMDEVQRVKPVLLSDIAGPDNLFSLDPRREDVVQAVKNLEVLVNHQIKRQNDWFRIADTLVDDMLIRYIGVLKYGWRKEKRPVDIREFELDEISYLNLKQQPNIEIDEDTVEESEETVVIPEQQGVDAMGMPVTIPAIEQVNKTYKGTLTEIVEFEGFEIQAISPTDVGFYFSEESISDESFFFHRLRMDDFEVEKEFGKDAMKSIKRNKDDAAKVESKDIDPLIKRMSETFGSMAEFMFDEDNEKWLIYECFYKNPDNGKAWRKVICGEVVMLTERNKYFRPPFFVGSPILKGHASVGYCAHTLTKEPQKLRTFLYRQISDNILLLNHRRYFGDPERLNLGDYLGNNNTGSLIRTVGDPRTVVSPEEKGAIPSEVFGWAEQINSDKDIHGITPRAFGGVSKTVVNRSFRGQNQQMQAASSKAQMISRVIAETMLIPLAREAMNCNIRFLSQEQHLRYFHEYMTISKQNISDQAEVVVNIGLGTNSKDQQVAQLQQVFGLMMQTTKMQIPVFTAQNFFHVTKELLNVMGYKDTSNFATDPKQSQTVTQLVQMLMMFIGQAAQHGVQIPPQIVQAVQQVAMAFHVKPPQMPGQQQPSQGGTFSGQNTPHQGEQPTQPNNPRITPDGGGFSA